MVRCGGVCLTALFDAFGAPTKSSSSRQTSWARTSSTASALRSSLARTPDTRSPAGRSSVGPSTSSSFLRHSGGRGALTLRRLPVPVCCRRHCRSGATVRSRSGRSNSGGRPADVCVWKTAHFCSQWGVDPRRNGTRDSTASTSDSVAARCLPHHRNCRDGESCASMARRGRGYRYQRPHGDDRRVTRHCKESTR